MWEQNGGKCGVCGDAYHLESPRPHEAGGEYAKGIISKFYAAGQVCMPLLILCFQFYHYEHCHLRELKMLSFQIRNIEHLFGNQICFYT